MPNTITNGFDITRINNAFKGRLGWHQTSFSNAPVINSDNLSATSGRYYDRGFHGAVSAKNYYYALADLPVNSTNFNQILADEDQAVTARCVNAIFNKPQLIEHKTNYVRTRNLFNMPTVNGGNAAGYRINVAQGDYAVIINSVSLYFDGVATFNLYLFNDLILEPVYTQEVTTEANSQTIVQLDWLMNNMNTGTAGNNMGGVWYLCYFQDDLDTVKAINEQLNIWTDTKIFGAYPFQSPKVADKVDFVRSNPAVNFLSYGLNMEVSSYRDYTQMIVQNAPLFDEIRGLTMALNILEQIKYSISTGGNTLAIQQAISPAKLDVNGAEVGDTSPFIGDLTKRIEREMKTINDNFWKKPQAMSVPIGNSDWTNELYYEGMDIRNLPSRELAN